MKYQLLFLGAVGMMGASADVLTFDCSVMPEICKSMCYGANCMGVGTSLNYDKLADAKKWSALKSQRRKAAGCLKTGGNRCSSKNNGGITGVNCDEYPFASTDASGTRGNRCVPTTQNSKQGGMLNGFYSSKCKNTACKFTVGFTQETAIDVCTKKDKASCAAEAPKQEKGPNGSSAATTSDTAGDGTDSISGEEFTKRDIADQVVRRYLTSTGRTISIPGGAEIGETSVWMEPRNATMFEEHAEEMALAQRDLGDDYDIDDDVMMGPMVENLEVREDTIVEEIFS
ncbi:hypothetical protein BGZ60DRAFT_188396 [Tricladium varicosporioides]|nr:hypothetical protein BGZ60DRAFT_188396 [Hymenoscyphus varicosporioides]